MAINIVEEEVNNPSNEHVPEIRQGLDLLWHDVTTEWSWIGQVVSALDEPAFAEDQECLTNRPPDRCKILYRKLEQQVQRLQLVNNRALLLKKVFQLLNKWIKCLLNWTFFLVLLFLFHSAKADCDYGKDSRCPSFSFREITATSGEDVPIGTIPDYHKPSYQLKLNVYESGVEPFKCCVIPWGSQSCTTCGNATLGYERNGSHVDITLLNIRKGLTFHLKIEGPVFYHSYDGIMLVPDNENPVISGCPSDQSVNTDSGNYTAVVTWTPPTATDNSGSQMLTSTNDPGDYFPVGNTPVTYTSIDGSLNTETCTFHVHVIDVEPPMIFGCPSDQNVNTDSGNDTAVVTWTPPTAIDNSGSQLLTTTNDPGDYFPVGNTPVTYTSIDGSLNKETCTFHVHVTGLSTSGKGLLIPLLVPLVLCNLVVGVCYVIWILIKFIKKKRGLSTSGKWFVRIPIPLLVLLVLCNLFGVCYVIWILIKSFKKKRDERYRSVPTQLSPSSPTQPQEQAPDQVPIDVEPDPNNENLQMRRL